MRLALALLPALAAAQSWHVGGAAQVFASFGPQGATRTPEAINPVFTLPVGCIINADGSFGCDGGITHPVLRDEPPIRTPKREATVEESLPVRLRITASRQPISVLRAITREKPPEGAGVYAVRACNVSQEAMAIDSGVVEQMLEAHGIALVPWPLAMLAIERGRSKAWGAIAKGGEISSIGGAVTSGLKISGSSRMSGWIPLALTGVGIGLGLAQDLAEKAKQDIVKPIDLPRLSNAGRIALAAGDCSGRLLAMGSYSRGQSATVVIEVD